MSQSGTYVNASSIGAVQFLEGNTGGAIGPDAGGIIYVPGSHGLNSAGAGNTVTFAINNAITLGDLANLAVGIPALTLTTGDLTISATGSTAGNINMPITANSGGQGVIKLGGSRWLHNGNAISSTFVGLDAGNFATVGIQNTALGNGALTAVTTGTRNVAIGAEAASSLTTADFGVYIGFQAGRAVTVGGSVSVAVGYQALAAHSAAGDNIAIGNQAMRDVTGADSCVGIGSMALWKLVNGIRNCAVGTFAGSNYIGAETDNICIVNLGTAGDNNTIRIGNNPDHTSCYIAGIDGVNVGSVATVVTESGTQLGTAVITAGTGISVTPGANTITIASTGGVTTLDYVNVNTTPYVVAATDDFLGVDCSGGVITVQLPNAPTTGRVIYIKDRTGSANTFNITVTTVGGAVNIDGATSYTMNTNYAAIGVLFDGTTYQIF